MKFRLFDSQALIGQSPDNDVVLTRPWTVDRLIEDLYRFDIDLYVVSHRLSYDWCPYQGNLELTRQLKAQPRLYSCFVILPSHTDEQPTVDDCLDQMRTASVAMVRLCPTHFRFSAAPTVLKDWYSRLERHRIPVFFDTTGMRLTAIRGLECPNVYSDLCRSWTEYNYIAQAIAAFGAENLVWGSDFPFIGQPNQLAKVAYAPIPIGDKTKMLTLNALKIISGLI